MADPMTWAVIGSAAIGAGAQIFGANKAADAMAGSASAQNALAQQIYGQQRSDQMPYMQSGYQALNALNRLYGLGQVSTDTSTYGSGAGALMGLRMTPEKYKNKRAIYVDKDGNGFVQAQYGENKGEWVPVGSFPQYKMEETQGSTGNTQNPVPTEEDRYGGFYASPGYQFRLDEGTRALDRSAASRGLLLSGAQNKAITRYGQGVASEEFGNYANALRNIAGLGQVSNQSVAGSAGQYAANAGNAMANAGMARASGYLGMGNAIGGIANSVAGSLPFLFQNSGGNNIRSGSDAAINWAINQGR